MKMKRILSMLAATAVMASSVAVMGVSADETTTGGGTDTTRTYSVDEAVVDVDLLPGIDADWKQISADDEKLTTSDVTYLSDPAIPTVEITETDSGAIRFKMGKDINKELRTWYDAQCDLNLENVFINGKYLYIKDGDTVWNPGWQPTKTELDSYECRHGIGYSRFTSSKVSRCTERSSVASRCWWSMSSTSVARKQYVRLV